MNIKKVGLIAALVASVSLSSQAVEIKAADESILTSLCMTALSGNRAAMHNKVREVGYSKNFIAKNLQCNGTNVLTYIQQYGKNSAAMLHILDQTNINVSITDLAQNQVVEN